MAPSPSHKLGVAHSDDSRPGASSGKTEILFRVWKRGSEHNELSCRDEANEKQQTGPLALIEDVVASRQGVLIAADDNLYISVLENPSQALVVARQVQLGMQEFKKKSRIQPIAISIAIDAGVQAAQSTETRSSSVHENEAQGSLSPKVQASHDLLTLIRMSKPAQILLTHELLERVNLFRGLPLKDFQGRFGVSEYLWTTEANLIELEGEHAAFVSTQDFQSDKRVEIKGNQLESFDISAGTARAPRQLPQSDEAITSGSHFWRLPQSFAIAAVLVVLLVTVAGIAIRSNKTNSEGSSVPIVKTLAPAPQTQPGHSNPVLPSRRAVGSTMTPKSSVKANENTPVTELNKLKQTSRPSHKLEEVPAKSGPANPCILSGPMEGYVLRAEEYRGRGDYPNALRLFNEVLACDPSNEQAQLGIARTRAATGRE